MYLLLFLSLARSEGLSSSLDEGDAAWCEGDIKLAKESWKTASNDSNPAVQALAEFRLLQTSSNLGWTIHGIRGDSALEACSPYDAWCGMAWVDREILLQQLGVPVNRDMLNAQLDLIESELPGPVMARRVWIGDKPAEALNGFPLDGLGRCLSQSDWPEDNPRPFIGFGVTGGGMLGIGGAVSVIHPFSRTSQLQAALSYTTKRAGNLGLVGIWGKKWGGISELQVSRQPYFLYTDYDSYNGYFINTLSLSGGPKRQFDQGQIMVGAVLRTDMQDDGEWIQGHGPTARAIWIPLKNTQIVYRTEGTWVDYSYWRNDFRVQWIHHAGPAIQLNLNTVVGDDTTWWRLPTAGGGLLMRTPQAQQIRSDVLPVAIAEWRIFQERVIGLTLFSEASYVERVHWGAGGGFRFRLPPQPHNTVRVDVGYGDLGWGFAVGMGEFF